MTPATLLAEIEQVGSEVWTDGDRLKFRAVPARLIPAIREHKAALLAILKDTLQSSPPAQTDQRSTPPASVAPEPDMAPQSAPATVSCGQCVRFQPGPQPLVIGRCLATANGLPPKEQRGYLAPYPMAPRRCPEYAGSAS